MKLVFAVFRLSGFSGGAARRDSIWNFHVWNEVSIISNLKKTFFSFLYNGETVLRNRGARFYEHHRDLTTFFFFFVSPFWSNIATFDLSV